MNTYLGAACVLALIVEIVHSALGEVRIFNHLRRGAFVPINGGALLLESNVRILLASWHAVTVFGWRMAAMLPALSPLVKATTIAAGCTAFVIGLASMMLRTSAAQRILDALLLITIVIASALSLVLRVL